MRHGYQLRAGHGRKRVDGVVGPAASQQVDGLVRTRAPLAERDAEGRELLLQPATRGAQDQTPPAHDVERAEHLREQHGRAQGQDENGRAETHALVSTAAAQVKAISGSRMYEDGG